MKFLRRLLLWLLGLGLLLGLLFLLRVPILRGIGYFLIRADSLRPVDAAFILSGHPAERCPAGADVYRRGFTPLLIPTGAGVNPTLEALDLPMTDAQVGQQALWDLGVDSSAIRPIAQGTSTFEESEQILGYSLSEGFQTVMVISSQFHTRRIQSVFKAKFQAEGIDVVVHGAEPPAEAYDIDAWLQSEQGLIFVNNEYMKLLYYAVKY